MRVGEKGLVGSKAMPAHLQECVNPRAQLHGLWVRPYPATNTTRFDMQIPSWAHTQISTTHKVAVTHVSVFTAATYPPNTFVVF